MPRNKLSDLNNHLFAQIEKLTDEENKFNDEEVARSKALSGLASQVINIHKLVLDAHKEIVENSETAEIFKLYVVKKQLK